MLKPISQMRKGEKGIIKKLGELPPSDLRKLLSLDLVPETEFYMISHSPSFVIKSKFSELVIDSQLAREIFAETK